jgi:membrane protein implicated in regulation of membrane protease activity
MPMMFAWWTWLLVGLILIAIELISPGGFFILFFGVGALVVGVLDLLGFSLGLPWQVLLFLALSIAGLLIFRKPMKEWFSHMVPSGKVDTLIGEVAQAMEDIPAGGLGKVELRGSAWNAHNLGASVIPRAARCRVENVDGLTLQVRV